MRRGYRSSPVPHDSCNRARRSLFWLWVGGSREGNDSLQPSRSCRFPFCIMRKGGYEGGWRGGIRWWWLSFERPGVVSMIPAAGAALLQMSGRCFASGVQMGSSGFLGEMFNREKKESPHICLSSAVVFQMPHRFSVWEDRPGAHRSITSASLNRFIQYRVRLPSAASTFEDSPPLVFYLWPRKPRCASSCEIISGDGLPRGLVPVGRSSSDIAKIKGVLARRLQSQEIPHKKTGEL